MSQQAKQILHRADVDKLPSLPHVLLQLLEICHDESISYKQLTAVLNDDPGLYTRIHSVCHRDGCDINSTTGKPLSPEQTLKNLGINTIKSIAVTTAVQQFFSRSSLERTEFLKQHWHHSLYCAYVAESLARHSHYHDPNEAYTAGLLHDIGQLVLEATFPEKYTITFAQLSEDDLFHNLELDEFNATHQEVGAEMLKRHGINHFIHDAVLYHHESIEQIQDAHPLVKIVNIANSLTSSYFKEEDIQVIQSAEELLGLEKSLLTEILEKSQEKVKNTANALEIILAHDGMDGETAKQQTASDEFKQLQLAEQVRNIALLDGIHQHLSRNNSYSDVHNIITQHIGILFGVNDCILFLYDHSQKVVKAIAAEGQPYQLADIAIPLGSNRSLVTDALLQKNATHSFENDITALSIIDRQLIGLLDSSGILCFPMIANNETIGTLVFGVNQTQNETLAKQIPLLNRFVSEIAVSISNGQTIGSTDADGTLHSSQEQKVREVLHEVRNPLSIINNYLSILSYKLENDKTAQEDVETIKAEIERVGEILNRLTVTDEPPGEVAPVDLNSILTDLTNVFQSSLFEAKDIQISLDLDERIESLQSNANALKQIYTNLIKNAVEALPANGQVMVYTQDNVNVDGVEHVELSVADDGPGIDADILPQLFSPVESTKGDGHAGLGLTIVKNMVGELHGSISCRSSDKGTSFHILLPKITA